MFIFWHLKTAQINPPIHLQTASKSVCFQPFFFMLAVAFFDTKMFCIFGNPALLYYWHDFKTEDLSRINLRLTFEFKLINSTFKLSMTSSIRPISIPTQPFSVNLRHFWMRLSKFFKKTFKFYEANNFRKEHHTKLFYVRNEKMIYS